MTLLTVPWLLPKASVEYAWVQPPKLLLSALKSVGSPTQQMQGGRGGAERKLTEREEERTCLTYLQWWKINQIFLSSCCPCKESIIKRSLKLAWYFMHSTACVRVQQLCFCAHVRMHAAVCVLGYGSAWMCVCKCFCECLSILSCLKLWTVARQLWQAAQHSAGQPRSRHFHMPMVLISGTGQRWYITRSESHQAKSQSIAGMI